MIPQDKKINILEIVSDLGYGGTARIMLNYAKNIDRDIFNVFIVAFSGGIREEALKQLAIAYIITDEVAKIVSLIKERQIDVIHFHRSGHFVQNEFEIISQAKKANPKLVIIEASSFSKYDARIHQYIDCSLHNCQMMLLERYIKEVGHFDFAKTKVVYVPVDYNYFDSMTITDQELADYKKSLGIESGDFVIGKMARPHIAKWSDLLLEMMPYLIKLVPRVKFIIQAIPESRKKVVKRSAGHDHYILLDPSDDKKVALFYKTIDVYVHASKIGESFGLTLAEAGAFGKPVVVNSTPERDNNQIEWIDHLKNGIIANHPQTFARAVAYLYEHPAERLAMGQVGRQKVVKYLEPKKITQQLEKVIIEKLASRGLDIDSKVVDFYNNIPWQFTEQEIKDFAVEYQQRLQRQFGTLSWSERWVNRLRYLKRFYYKVKDFLEDQYGFKF